VDGLDTVDIIGPPRSVAGYYHYFKQECSGFGFPISFCIPEEKIWKGWSCAQDAYERSTGRDGYVYRSEEELLQGYQEAWNGDHDPEGGLGLHAHYEIMANGCIPIFLNISVPAAHLHVTAEDRLLTWFRDLRSGERDYLLKELALELRSCVLSGARLGLRPCGFLCTLQTVTRVRMKIDPV